MRHIHMKPTRNSKSSECVNVDGCPSLKWPCVTLAECSGWVVVRTRGTFQSLYFQSELCEKLIVESVTGLSMWKSIHLESLVQITTGIRGCTSEQHGRTRRCICGAMVTEKMVSSSSLSILPLPSWSNSLKYHLSFWLISPFNSRLIAAIYSTKSM